MKISKRYSSYKSQPKVLKLVLNFLPNGPHKTAIVEILSFWLLTFFFPENLKFTIVAYGEKNPLNFLEKRYANDRRAKRSEIWDSWMVVQHIWSTLGLVAFKVILSSSSAMILPENTISKNTASTNTSQNLSNFPYIIFSLVLTKPHLGFVKCWKLKFQWTFLVFDK